MFQTRASRTRVETDRTLNATADVAGVSRRAGFGGDVVVANMLTGDIESYDTQKPTAKPRKPQLDPSVPNQGDRPGRRRTPGSSRRAWHVGADDHNVERPRSGRRSAAVSRPPLERPGRVAEVASGHLDKDKTNDVIAEFGWLNTGSLTVVHNPSRATKKACQDDRLDSGRGATSVQVGDLTGDGKHEAVALFGQEREEAIVYQQGGWPIRRHRDFSRRDATWGATRLRLSDLDKMVTLMSLSPMATRLTHHASQSIHVRRTRAG